MREENTAIRLVDLDQTENTAPSFALMRQHLQRANIITNLLWVTLCEGEGSDYSDPESDPILACATVTGVVSQAEDCAESLDNDSSREFGLYRQRMLFVSEHFSLLATKAGCSDFDRVAAAGLAKWLMQGLLDELKQYEPVADTK